MKKQPVVIFGNQRLAALTSFCLASEGQWKVKAFTVDKQYLTKNSYEGLPVVPFEDLSKIYPPDSVKILISLGYSRINGLRMERFYQAVDMGYQPATYLSDRAVTWPGLNLGKNCIVFAQAIIQPYAKIGDNVIIRNAANIGHHCVIGSHFFIASGVTFGGNVTVGERCFFGLSSVIRDGITVAPRTFIGAGAVVLTDTEEDGVYVGNPAKRIARTSLEVSK
ncbi:MAG: acetyltransferase [Desulfovibrionales bacterium]|nr:acetyltransferase [Desulfovibrionales bacterium]